MTNVTSTLTVAVDSTQVKTATQTLQELSTAGRQSETATAALQREWKQSAAAAKTLSSAQASVAAATKLSAHQTVQLSAQLQDFFVQVQAGQSPVTALLQQGSQLHAVFGGLRPAMAALGTVFTATRVAAGGLAGSIAGVVLAAYQGSEESRRLTNLLTLTGNAAGITAGQFNLLAQNIAAGTQTSIGSTRDTLEQLVSTGRFSGDALRSAAQSVQLLSKATGESTEQIVQRFTGMVGSVARGATELNARYHFLDAAQLASIKSAEDSGDAQRALTITFDALNPRLTSATANLGFLERAYNAVGRAASKLADEYKGLGRDKTVEDSIAKVQQRIADLQLPTIANTANPARTAERLASARAELVVLQAQRTAAEGLAKAAADQVKSQGAAEKFAQLQSQYRSSDQRMKDQIQQVTELGREGKLSAEEIKKLQDAVRKSFQTGSAKAPFQLETGGIANYIEQLDKQLERENDLTQVQRTRAELQRMGSVSLEDAQKAFNRAASIDTAKLLEKQQADEKRAREDVRKVVEQATQSGRDYIATLMKENDALAATNKTATEHLQEMGLTTEELGRLRLARMDETIAVQERALADAQRGANDQAEVDILVEKVRLLREQRDIQSNTNTRTQLVQDRDENKRRTEGLADSIEQGILTGFRDGKKAGDIFRRELEAQFAKTVLRPIIQPVAETASNLLPELFKLISGNAFTAGGTRGLSWSYDKANGGYAPPGSIQRVNERGPEMLEVGGSSFLMMGSQGGNVIPNGKGMGGGFAPSTVVNVGGGMNRAEVHATVTQALEANNRMWAAQLEQMGVIGA